MLADAEESRTDATLVVTLTNTPGALRRVTASLGTIPVSELTYAASLASRGTARITLPWKSADRARNKLNRLVEVLAVTDAAP
ncbi:hypothetical protein ACTVZO_40715 [Streptomyces sp. IBSNAI002]|uniref:hypothetical protein n=1 Tax=Streptomyces sp. IBSNAI002 TaxID=3457500 RepID=UPI003FD407A1